ncbi:glycoprotease family-domain-containing protein [Echria macrotheca]|uniref:N(6)-L-threonylcarbamoyladenine synthase n=1 Tax=Echria macrotheca TaxID=438768 RepID=A0AAJ0BKC9_9PEZI|nr:glycoprotease family-domain-containing protein [Echria macrotheca]
MSNSGTPRGGLARPPANAREEWEDWTDEEPLTPMNARDGPLINTPQPSRPALKRLSASASAAGKPSRLKSRARQQAFNARAGIKVITDMAQLRQGQHIAHQMKAGADNRQSRTGKFVDAAALIALEGGAAKDSSNPLPSWLKKKPTQAKGKAAERLGVEEPSRDDISPVVGPIMIGFEMPKDSSVIISPQTAVVETPVGFSRYFGKPPKLPSPKAPVSAWSPDSEDGSSSRRPNMAEGIGGGSGQRSTKATTAFATEDEDDMSTPVTLFEEDGSPLATRQKSLKQTVLQRTMTVVSTRSQGWWDQVTTPFTRTPDTPQAPDQQDNWWKDVDSKQPRAESGFAKTQTPRIVIQEANTPSPTPSPEPTGMSFRERMEARNNRADRERDLKQSSELPPPYSPPSSKKLNPRYRAVFPPDHPRSSMYPQPPSPGPGAIGLRNVPLTPPPVATYEHDPRLPDRPLGSFLPGDQLPAMGRGSAQRVERQRRRHEKEDAVAWKAGRLWHGRSCLPTCCVGRPGPEGRKRRRVCLGLCIAMLILVALAVTLPLVLLRGNAPAPVSSIFLNLTDFPPMPTGVLTVAGTDADTTSNCVTPATMWSCALPKEQAGQAAPYDGSKPSFILQIQFDNSTNRGWDTPQGVPPIPSPVSPSSTPISPSSTPVSSPTTSASRSAQTSSSSSVRRRGRGGSVGASLETRQTSGFKPDPAPPDFQEMFFLGNTTDGVVSSDKAGEPTPFYISILQSVDDSVGPTVLSRQVQTSPRQLSARNISLILPPPSLNPDGTGAPAVLLPFPRQQPVRLYDRGLPTERFAFYTYFDKTTYLKSVTPPTDGQPTAVPADENGGARETEANFVMTWLSTRYKVEIWTRRANATRLVSDPNRAAGNSTRPGTFPYPITITLDTHGGQPGKKFGFVRSVDERQRIVLDNPKLVANNMNIGGSLVNPQESFNPSFGGMDGGTGGCKRELRRRSRGDSDAFSVPRHPLPNRQLTTLAIETSCDDTCVAVLSAPDSPSSSSPTTLLYNKKITSDNSAYAGIHPKIAILSHTTTLSGLVEQAIHSSLPHPPDFISVTRGPGMPTNLSVGLCTAKGLALAWRVPLVGVHHMQAHALTPRLVHALSPETENGVDFPFLTVLVSGGHTLLVHSKTLTEHEVLASTESLPLGNMLDQVARWILPGDVLAAERSVGYGALLERFAFGDGDGDGDGEKYAWYAPPRTRFDEIQPYDSSSSSSREEGRGGTWKLTPPLADRRAMAYSFTGLNSQVQRIVSSFPDSEGISTDERRHLARATMQVAFEHLASRVIFALEALSRRQDARLSLDPGCARVRGRENHGAAAELVY